MSDPTLNQDSTSSLFSRMFDAVRNWKVLLGLVLVALLGTGILFFSWGHLMADLGMNVWSSKADASPIECMFQDTNDDKYISCSAMLNDEVVPLECGSSLFNIGCRVNYGAAAAPPVRKAS